MKTDPVGARPAGRVGGPRGTLWWSLAFSGASVVLHAPGFVVRLFNSDEASLASIAMAINRGATLYHTTADRKPPIVPYVYALVFRVTGSVDIRLVRVVAAVAVGLCAALLAVEARRRYGSPGAGLGCGVLFLLAVTAFFPDDSQAAGFEVFMLLPMTAAVVLAARRRYLGAGLALAAACLCKQTAVTTAVPVLWWAWRRGGPKAVGRTAAGFVAPIAAAAALFGPGPFLLWTVSG
ncbi:MAG TPA: glycosyltransferase family 39 protein, partial [Acidimicrobiia bacterium]|nr:glycosyltransferase family 39 protein [Acidimicrobiia bacterium]